MELISVTSQSTHAVKERLLSKTQAKNSVTSFLHLLQTLHLLILKVPTLELVLMRLTWNISQSTLLLSKLKLTLRSLSLCFAVTTLCLETLSSSTSKSFSELSRVLTLLILTCLSLKNKKMLLSVELKLMASVMELPRECSLLSKLYLLS